MARRPIANFAGLAVGFVVIASFAVAVVVYYLGVLPVNVLLYGVLLAVVPLVIVLIGIRLVDSWEPEPKVALVFAFLWGAVVAVGGALIFDFALQGVESAIGTAGTQASATFGAVVQAPIVEETAKGLGVLLVLLIFRRTFDGPIDGIVYAATVAAGFAFVENVQYFSVAVVHQATGQGGLAGTFLVRALMAPFGHIVYTACTGFALGVASRRTSGAGVLGYLVAGLVPAVLLHALWNGALTFVGGRFFDYYVLVWVPIFAACVVLVIVLRALERRTTRVQLADYRARGWFDDDEVAMLSSGRARKRAKQWAARSGHGRDMARFIADATRLASTRQRLLSSRGRAAEIAARDEAELLQTVAASRAAIRAPVV